ncbi:MAG: thymidylate synthase, partial [Pseudomonadota bacterium]
MPARQGQFSERAGNPFDGAYLDLLADVLENGSDRSDRTGVGARSVFGRQMR